MSLLNINPANQSELSGQQRIVTVSGSTSVVAIAGVPGGSTFVDVQSSVASDDIATTTDALATQSLTYGYNLTNNQWARATALPIASGAGFALVTKQAEPPTFRALGSIVDVTSGVKFLSIHFVSGEQAVKIKDIRLHNMERSLISGQALVIAVWRTSINPTGGNSHDAKTMDIRNNQSGISLTIRSAPTNISTYVDKLSAFHTINTALFPPESTVNPGAKTNMIASTILNATNLAPNGGAPSTQDFTLTSGYGITIGQDYEETQRTSGQFRAEMVYTVEPA